MEHEILITKVYNHFKKNIKNWIECDNYLIENQEKIKQINEKTKAVKKKREELSNNITTYMKNNNMHDNIINISDGDLRYNETVAQTPITLKHLKFLLEKYYQDNNSALKIYNYIKENREYKKIIDLKRKINT